MGLLTNLFKIGAESLMRSRNLFLGILLLAVCLSDCSREPDASGRRGTGRAEVPSAAGPTVAVTRVSAVQLERKLQLPGDLLAFQDVAIYPKVQGFIQRITVDRGSRVRRGELMIQMTAPELDSLKDEAEAKSRMAASQSREAAARLQSARSQRLEAEARLAAEQATYERLRAAAATPGVVAGNDLELAQRAAEAAGARLDASRENEKAAEAQVRSLLESEKAAADYARSSLAIESYLRVTAPFDGVITERNVHEGSLVGPATPAQPPMVRIQEVSRLRLTVYVPEAEAGAIEPGAEVKFVVPAYPGENFSGSIQRVAHALDPKTRTMPVELDVLNPTGRLAPGMYAEVQWPSRRHSPSLLVPPSAVAVNTERIFVIRIRNGVAEWVDVRRGATTGNLVEVFGELSAGDEVAVRGTDELRAGTRVESKLQ